MPKVNEFNDREVTFEVKTFYLTLNCGKCFPGELIASDRKTEEEEIIHVCNKCGREQAVKGPGYPRTEERKTEVGTSYIKRVEYIPDPNERSADFYVRQSEVSQMNWQQQLELLRTTTDVETVDHLEYATVNQLRNFEAFRNELYHLSAQAATIRAETLPIDIGDFLLNPGEAFQLPNATLAKLLSITRFPENVEAFKNLTEHILLFNPEYREVLYNNARFVVAHRNLATLPVIKPGEPAPVKNKGGRPRKNPLVAA